MSKVIRTWSHIDKIPYRRASKDITECCFVLEGGAFRGVYGEGVTDYLMYKGINPSCIIGESAGALYGLNMLAGQIGRAARINLTFRHDSEYVGAKAIRKNKGIFGFDFAFNTYNDIEPIDEERMNSGLQRFVCVATRLRDGKPVYFEYGKCPDINIAIQASASMPFFSKPVVIDGQKYLDGGNSDKIPVRWAMQQGYEKIVVITTRPAGYRKKDRDKFTDMMAPRVYKNYPEYATLLMDYNAFENQQRQDIELLAQEGRIFKIDPPAFINEVGRLESDMEKLGHLYYLGYRDGKRLYKELKKYFEK